MSRSDRSRSPARDAHSDDARSGDEADADGGVYFVLMMDMAPHRPIGDFSRPVLEPKLQEFGVPWNPTGPIYTFAIPESKCSMCRQWLHGLGFQLDRDGGQCKLHTITLKARSEFSNNVDNIKVAGVLGSFENVYVRNFAFNDSPHPLGCAWLTIKFGTCSEQLLPDMYRAVAAFLEQIQHLRDCHRISQTMNFIDEYDGNWDGSPEETINEIIRRLPEKVRVEMHGAEIDPLACSQRR